MKGTSYRTGRRGALRMVMAVLLAVALVLQGFPATALAEGLTDVDVSAIAEVGDDETAPTDENAAPVDEEVAVDAEQEAEPAEVPDAVVETEAIEPAGDDAGQEAVSEDDGGDGLEVQTDSEGSTPLVQEEEEPVLAAQAIDMATYRAKRDAFINDARWAHGTYWPQIPPKLSTYSCWGCFAYACDFTTYVYGVNNYQEGQAFYSASEIRTGDVIRISGHTFVVLERNGNDLYTAEGAFSDAVRIANPGYKVTASGGLTDTWGNAKTFETGYHFDITGGGNILNLGDDFHAYLILNNGWRHTTASADAAYGQLTVANANDSFDPRQIWRFIRQSDGSYKIKSAYWADFEGEAWYLQADNAGTTSGTAVNMWKNSGSAAQNWYLTGSQGDCVLRNANCSLVMDATGGSNAGGTPFQLYAANGSSAQSFSVYYLSQDSRTYVKPAKPGASYYTGDTVTAVGEPTALTWSESKKVNEFDKRTYDVTVKDSSGKTVLSRTGLTGTSLDHTFASAGTYTVQVRAVNSYYRDWYTDGSASTVTVYAEADDEPPVITDFSIASQTDEEIVFDVWATDNVGVTDVACGSYTGIGAGPGSFSGPASVCNEVEEGHWTVTIRMSSTGLMVGDRHAAMVFALDAYGNSTLMLPINDLEYDNPNPIIFYEYEASPHFTLKVGETITKSELFGNCGNACVYYLPTNEGDRVLSFDGTISGHTYEPASDTYTASKAGTGTYVAKNQSSGRMYGAVVTVVPDVVDLSGAKVTLPYANAPYTGKAITPSPTVTLDGVELSEGTDYEVSYSSNVSVGRATVTVTGVGGYVGTATATFRIARVEDGWYTFADGAKGYGRGGKLVTGWFDLDGGKYWFDDQGRMATGWTDLVVDGKEMHYYFRPSGNLARGAWADIDGTKYYFRASGNMATGWADIDGRKYWFDSEGQMVTGWRDIDNGAGTTNHYYFRPSGSMATGWAQIDGASYYFRPSGNMATGFTDVTDDAYKRYFDESGRMLTGWQEINGNTYYFRSSGAMQTGEATIDGMACTFTDKGVLIG